jgi:hypothetical protein
MNEQANSTKSSADSRPVVARVSIGHRFDLRGEKYTVVGSVQMRGKYSYRVREEATNAVRSINRDKLIALQQDGSLKFQGVA